MRWENAATCTLCARSITLGHLGQGAGRAMGSKERIHRQKEAWGLGGPQHSGTCTTCRIGRSRGQGSASLVSRNGWWRAAFVQQVRQNEQCTQTGANSSCPIVTLDPTSRGWHRPVLLPRAKYLISSGPYCREGDRFGCGKPKEEVAIVHLSAWVKSCEASSQSSRGFKRWVVELRG